MPATYSSAFKDFFSSGNHLFDPNPDIIQKNITKSIEKTIQELVDTIFKPLLRAKITVKKSKLDKGRYIIIYSDSKGKELFRTSVAGADDVEGAIRGPLMRAAEDVFYEFIKEKKMTPLFNHREVVREKPLHKILFLEEE